ncbi:MAG: hypothetical protein KDI64_19550, partial [Candidatus Accumulibacter sp.]|nr:hypothetical protein [Accumulibacter sp.]
MSEVKAVQDEAVPPSDHAKTESVTEGKAAPPAATPARAAAKPAATKSDARKEEPKKEPAKAKEEKTAKAKPAAQKAEQQKMAPAAAQNKDVESVKSTRKTPLKTKNYEKALAKLQVELVKLQEWIKFKKLKVVVLFEGRDAA